MSTQLKVSDLVKKTQINLSFNGLHDSNIEVLVEVLQKSKVLKELNLWSNSIALSDDKFTDALKTNSTIQVLSLGSNRISSEGGKRLAAALKVNKSIREIHLGDNKIGDEGAKDFADALMVNQSLQKIGLYGNNIGDEGAESLANSFKVNPSLRVIWLHENKIGDKGAEKLADALEANQDIGLLFLLGNGIGSQVTGKINALLRDPKRKTHGLENIMAAKDVPPATEKGGAKKDEPMNSDDVIKQLNVWTHTISGLVEENFKTIMSPKKEQVVKMSVTEEAQDVAINTDKAGLDKNTQKEDGIEPLKAKLAAKVEELKAKEEEIKELKTKGDPAKNEEIASLREQLVLKDELIESTARKLIPSALACKDAKIQSLNLMVAKKDAEIVSLKEQVESQSEVADMIDTEIKQKDKRIDEVTKQLAEKDKEIASKDAAIVSLDDVIFQNGLALAKKDEELVTKDGEISSKNAALESKNKELTSKEAALVELTEAIASRDEQIVLMKATQASPLKQLELFIANKDTKISALETKLGLQSHKSTLETKLGLQSHTPIYASVDVTSNETESTCNSKKAEVASEQPEETRDDSEVPNDGSDQIISIVAPPNRIASLE